jgi:hypothetical protein
MTEERRNEARVQINLPVRWNGQSGTHEARIEDVSLGGCFVNTSGHVEKGEVVVLEVRLPSGEWLPLRGEVTSIQDGIGFGMVFTFLTEDEEALLREITG